MIKCFQILPARIQERNLSVCYAELKNERDLIEIRRKQLEVRDILKSLDKRHKVSEDLILKISGERIF